MGRRKLNIIHKCEFCGKVFPRSYNLNVHRRIHTGDKPYMCEEPGCTRSFAWKSSLDSHHLSHQRGALHSSESTEAASPEHSELTSLSITSPEQSDREGCNTTMNFMPSPESSTSLFSTMSTGHYDDVLSFDCDLDEDVFGLFDRDMALVKGQTQVEVVTSDAW
eukprot:CAMPEP_0198728798 /NCGR_PEP_ID=MMETSP1475-20131203/11758_1 /TAXON_ID= ORGANISM="Unidentified sp., Strain CCMP1999" /NCGR_SAMPLE_ID=MMETSP1475 /ASSEMBLY_ACC=CAM_ASM_001111 /LENGTH=163 /DNA_ID=CAMNT_0044491267 /DNA_START=121 /DNA_END=609 /DNA_ORIENTATION=-